MSETFYQKYITITLFGLLFFTPFQLYAQDETEIIIISDRVGEEIDKEERERFKLFQGVDGFQSAVFIKLPDGRLFLEITYIDQNTVELRSKQIQQSELLLKNRGIYIDNFEEFQAKSEKAEFQQSQNFIYTNPKMSLYLELLGKGFYSLNVDYRSDKSKAFSLGVQWVENAFIGSVMYYRFRGRKYCSEIGGGFSSIITDDGLMGIFINGVIGYRYQKKNGLLFRIGFTPLIGVPFTREGRFVIAPSLGISLGYSL